MELILHGRDEARLKAVANSLGGIREGDAPVVEEEASASSCAFTREDGQDGEERSSRVNARLGGVVELVGDVVAWAEDLKSIPAIEPVDGIVWSAGICELAAGQMLGLKALRRTLAVNLEAPLVVLSHFYRKGIIKDGGTIVLLGSQSAHDAGEGFSVYAASKGGLASAARVLGKEFARKDVAVHCLEPGTVDTPMTRKLVALFGGLKDGHEETMVSAEDVAADVVVLIAQSHGETRLRQGCGGQAEAQS